MTRRVADVMDATLQSFDARGNETDYTYDALGRVSTQTLPAVAAPGFDPRTGGAAPLFTHTMKKLYDLNGNPLLEEDANGNVTTYTYDAMNRELVTRRRMSSPNADDNAHDLITRYTYDAVGNRITVTDPNGHAATTTYDALLRPISVAQAVTTTTDPTSTAVNPPTSALNDVTQYFYGPNSGSGAFTFGGFNPTRVVQDANGVTGAPRVTDTIFDGAYRKVSVIQRLDTGVASNAPARGSEPETDFVYNASGQVVQQRVAMSRGGAGGAVTETTSTYYDNLERPTVVSLDLLGTGTGPNPATTIVNNSSASAFPGQAGAMVTRTAYDKAGHAISVTDPRGNTTTTTYDGAGRPTVVTQPAVTVFTVPGGQHVVTPTRTVTYDAAGNAVRTVDSNGSVSMTSFDARNRPTMTILDLNGDGTFNPTQSASAPDIVTRTGYDLAGNKVFAIDPNGNRTDITYDAANRQIQVLQPTVADAANGGALVRPRTTFAYDFNGNATSVTSPRNVVTTTTYDELNRPRFVTIAYANAPAGAADRSVSETRYDAVGNAVASVRYNADGSGLTIPQVTTFKYDTFNRRIEQDQPDPDGSGPLLPPVSHYAYDLVGNQTSMVDPRQQTTTYAYDRANRRTTVTEPQVTVFVQGAGYSLVSPTLTTAYDVAGNVASVTDARGHTTTYQYDALNRKTSQTQPNTAATLFGYDANGNLTSTTDPLQQTTTTTYDRANRRVVLTQPDPDGAGPLAPPVTTTAYDPSGNVVASTNPAGFTTTYGYDSLNRKTIETDPRPAGAGGGLLSPVTTSSYDQGGNLVASTDPLGHRTASQYDALNRRVTMTAPDPDGVGPLTAPVTHYAYDSVGNLLATTDPLGHVTTDAYDTLNRKVSEALPDPNVAGQPHVAVPVTTWGYDPNGNQISYTDADRNQTTFTYDALNRQLTATNALHQTSTRGYDQNGNLTVTVDRDGRTINYAYDTLDRRTAETWLAAGGATLRAITTAYDLAGRVLSVSDPDSSYAYQYDHLNRATQVSDAGTPGSPGIVVSLKYDANGNRLALSSTVAGVADLANAYVYDNLDRLTQITQTAPGDAASGWGSAERVTFGYDAAGRMTGFGRYADPSSAAFLAYTGYGYDADNRLIGLQHQASDSTVVFADYGWAYDAAGRVTHYNGPDGISAYGYNADNELTSALNSSRPNESYAYTANGNRASANGNSAYVTGPDNRLTSDGAYSYAYDAEGNPTLRTTIATGATLTYAWDYRNRLIGLTYKTAAGAVTSQVAYAYDADNRRISKTVTPASGPATSERYSYDPDGNADNLLLVLNGATGAVTHRLLQGPKAHQVLADQDAAKGATDPARTHWLLADAQQSVRDVLDANGAPADHLAYDSYGNVITQSDPSQAPRFQYTGMQADAESGLLFDFHRYYDPAGGRFVSQDPKGFAAGDGNLYRYVGNSPMDRVDPSGLAVETQVWEEAKQEVIQKYYANLGPHDSATIQRMYDTDPQFQRAVNWTHDQKVSWYASHAGRSSYVNSLASDAGSTLDDSWKGMQALAGFVYGYDEVDLREGLIENSKSFYVQKILQDSKVSSSYDDSVNSVLSWQSVTADQIGASDLNYSVLGRDLNGDVQDRWSRGLRGFGTLTLTIAAATAPAVDGVNSLTTGTTSTLDAAAGDISVARGTQPEPSVSGESPAGNSPGASSPTDTASIQKSGTCFRAGTRVLTATGLEPIETLRVGRRVGAEPHRAEASYSIDRKSYRLFRLAYSMDGQQLDMAFLRSARLAEGLAPGDTLDISLLEFKLRGPVRVIAIEPCPEIEQGSGRVITGTFNSTNAHLRSLKLVGLATPLEVTGEHPIFSEDGHDFVLASLLQPGERLRTLTGTAIVESNEQKHGQWEVFNLEIDGAHKYYVTEQFVLVHNINGDGPVGGEATAPENIKAAEDTPRQAGGDEPSQQQQDQGTGNYRNTHQSGKTYSSKGGTDRMGDSARKIANQNNDPVVSQTHTPAPDDTQSFIQEQNDIEAAGGPGGNTYNKINSPGKKLRDGQ